jgi:hypothetical protein
MTTKAHEAHDEPATQQTSAPAPTKMEVGGSATVKAAFKDAFGGEVKTGGPDGLPVTWQSSNAAVLVITSDAKDPSTAKLLAVAEGLVAVTAACGRAAAQAMVHVIQKGEPSSGEVTVSGVQAAPSKAAEPAAHAAHSAS